MKTKDGHPIEIGESAWSLDEPVHHVIIDSISYGCDGEPIIWVQPTDLYPEDGIYPRSCYELFFDHRKCLLAYRAMQYDNIRKYEEWIENTQKNIDKINWELDTM